MKMLAQTLSIDEAISQVRNGQIVLICDDEAREYEADMCVAAQFITPDIVNFMIHQACGLLCVSLAGERLDALQIPPAPIKSVTQDGPAFAASVDAVRGTTSGISALDRSISIQTLIDPSTRPDDLAYPGHVFPLRARPGGTSERRGHTEASVDLMKLAGLLPGAAICEVLTDQGSAARGLALDAFADQWGLGLLSVETIARARG